MSPPRATSSRAAGYREVRADGPRALMAPHILRLDGRDLPVHPATHLLAGVTSRDDAAAEHVALTLGNHIIALTYLLTVEEARVMAEQMLACADEVEATATKQANAAIARARGK